MDVIIKTIGFVLRLPFFLIAVVFLVVYSVVAAVAVAAWSCVVVPLCWIVVGIPFAFVSVAFQGSGMAQLKERLGEDVGSWTATTRRRAGALPLVWTDLLRWQVDPKREAREW